MTPLGLAKRAYHREHYEDAIEAYRQVLQSYPDTAAAPEALYFSGVCNYMTTHDPVHLKEASEALRNRYPGSDWAKKAEV